MDRELSTTFVPLFDVSTCLPAFVKIGQTSASISLALLLISSIVQAAPPKTAPSESLGNLLKKDALHIFELADQNKDEGLDQAEQADAAQRTKKAFSRYVSEHTLAGPRVPAKVEEPLIVNMNRMTSDEFIQQFQAHAAIYDAEVRARRITKSHQPVQNHGGSVVAANSKQAEKEKHSNYDSKDRIPAQKTQAQGLIQQQASGTGQSSVGVQPIHSGQIHSGGFVNHHSQHFGQQFTPGFNWNGPMMNGPMMHAPVMPVMNSGGGIGGGAAPSHQSEKNGKHGKNEGK